MVSRQLRPYQVDSVEWLVKNGSGILADEPGLGKSATALTAARRLTSGPILIVAAPAPALGVWRYESRLWLDEDVFTYQGPVRKDIWQAFTAGKATGIVVTNYYLTGEIYALKPLWGCIIFDESHHIRNRRSATKDKKTGRRKESFFDKANKLQAPYKFCLTGTPVVNGLEDLWTQLHIAAPKAFPHYWPFVNKYFRTYIDPMSGSPRIAGVKDEEVFRHDINRFILRRYKKDYLEELPDKIRQIYPTELSKEQWRLYNQLADEMLADVGDRIVLTSNAVSLLTRLRQVSVTPALIGGSSSSGTLDTVAALVEEEISSGRPVAIFTVFAAAIPHIEAAIAKSVDHIFIVRGGKYASKSYQTVQEFQLCRSHKKAIIATIQSAASWTATEAKTAIFVGAHWTPALNTQAEDRLHRQGQTDSVRCLYVTAEGTTDEHILDVLDKKITWHALALQPELLLHGKKRASFVDRGRSDTDIEYGSNGESVLWRLSHDTSP